MDAINDGVEIELIEKREQMVRDFIGETPALFTLAGGYSWGATEDDVVEWQRSEQVMNCLVSQQVNFLTIKSGDHRLSKQADLNLIRALVSDLLSAMA